jgi:hypothetical protein
MPSRPLEGNDQELSVSSHGEISARLRRLADQMGRPPREVNADSDELMAIHDELVEIIHELRRQISEP